MKLIEKENVYEYEVECHVTDLNEAVQLMRGAGFFSYDSKPTSEEDIWRLKGKVILSICDFFRDEDEEIAAWNRESKKIEETIESNDITLINIYCD